MSAPALASGAHGLSVAWPTSLGPALAHYPAWANVEPAWARHVGPVEPALTVDIGHTSSAIVVGWCAGDGAYAASFGPDGAPLNAPARVVAGAHRIALAAQRDAAALYCADGEGIMRVDLDARGAVLGSTRVVSHRQIGPILAASFLSAQALLLYAYPGEDAVGVTVSTHSVRHPVRQRVRDLAVSGVANRAGLLILSADGEVHAGTLSGRGKLAEKPRPIGRWESAAQVRLLWVDAHWIRAIREPDRLILARLDEADGASWALRLPDAPIALAYDAHRVTVLQQDEGSGELLLARAKPDGHEQQQRRERVTPTDTMRRRVERDGARTLEALAEALGSGGYRSNQPPQVHGLSLELQDAQGTMCLAIEPKDAVIDLVLRADPVRPEPPVPSTLLRLASWVRRGIRKDPWARAWGESTCRDVGGALTRIERAGGHLELRASLAALPSVDHLLAWIHRVRSEHDQRCQEEQADMKRPGSA